MEEGKTEVHRVGAFSGGGCPKDKGQCQNWEMISTQGIGKLANTLGIQKHLSEDGIMTTERETLVLAHGFNRLKYIPTRTHIYAIHTYI